MEQDTIKKLSDKKKKKKRIGLKHWSDESRVSWTGMIMRGANSIAGFWDEIEIAGHRNHVFNLDPIGLISGENMRADRRWNAKISEKQKSNEN